MKRVVVVRSESEPEICRVYSSAEAKEKIEEGWELRLVKTQPDGRVEYTLRKTNELRPKGTRREM